MSKYLNYDTEERTLESREDLEEYLDFRKANDIWVFPYVNECSCVGVSVHTNTEQSEATIEIPDTMVREAMADNRLLLIYPNIYEAQVQVLPIRYTAFSDLCNRAGLKGRTIEQMVDKGNISALDAVIKAQWLSVGLSLNGNESKILIRDEKISGFKSHKYQIFPESDLIKLLEKNLEEEWPNFSYDSGIVSHEYLYVDYLLNAPEMEQAFVSMLEEYGAKDIGEIKAGITMITSDVGNRSVIISPFYILDGVKMQLGKANYTRHDTSNSMETIEKAMETMASSFQHAEVRMEALCITSILHPKDCFLNIVEEYELPKTTAIDIAAEMDCPSCSAIDIYIALNGLVKRHYERNALSLTSLINLSESVSKLIYIDYETFDHERI